MHFESPGAIFLQLGPFAFRWYGLLITLGFIAAAAVGAYLAPKEGVPREKYIQGALTGFIGGVIGGRLYFCACEWSYYAAHPLSILATWEGGMSIHGGIIGGFAAGLTYAYFNGMPVLRCMDFGACGTVLAQAIGRWGNFFNSEAFGRPVPDDFPLKLFIPLSNRPADFIQFSYFHPTFLYESVINLAIFLFLFFYLVAKLKNYPGVSFFVYLALYSVGRLLIEPMRLDSLMASNNVPIPIIASTVELVASIVIIAALVVHHNHRMKKVALSGGESTNPPNKEAIKCNSDL